MTPTSVGFWTSGTLWLAASAPCDAGLVIRQQVPDCVVAEAFPRLSASITPAEQVVGARLLFAAEDARSPGAGWYAVSLVRQDDHGRVFLATGTPERPDPVLSYVFVP